MACVQYRGLSGRCLKHAIVDSGAYIIFRHGCKIYRQAQHAPQRCPVLLMMPHNRASSCPLVLTLLGQCVAIKVSESL